MTRSTITVSEVKNRPSKFLMERLERAKEAGSAVLDVLNRGRAVCHLGLAEDMPEEWQTTNPETVPLNELKRSQISLSRLRRQHKALLLAQRSGPMLGLWPTEARYERPIDFKVTEELDYLRREMSRLKGRVAELERKLSAAKKAL